MNLIISRKVIVMEKIKVLFLDIDGVLQPDSARMGGERFNIDRKALVERLTKELETDYYQYNEYDVAAVYCDWDKEAIATLKHILDETGAKIVVSSDWRENDARWVVTKMPNKMRDLLRIHGLDKYYIGDTPDFITVPDHDEKKKTYSFRVVEINHYLEVNKDRIENYVALDDMDLVRGGYVGNFIHTESLITKEQGEECILMLNKKPSKIKEIFNKLFKRG